MSPIYIVGPDGLQHADEGFKIVVGIVVAGGRRVEAVDLRSAEKIQREGDGEKTERETLFDHGDHRMVVTLGVVPGERKRCVGGEKAMFEPCQRSFESSRSMTVKISARAMICAFVSKCIPSGAAPIALKA